MIRKLLVANRGEIAVRIIRACRDLGIRAVAVYSDTDRDALHVRLAHEAYPIGPAPARDSYLRTDRVIAVAKRTGCDAVHPGYGFLSENADFAQAVSEAGLTFVGPAADVQRALGDKAAARRIAREAGVPVAAGGFDPIGDLEGAEAAAAGIGYPVLLKPVGGGGGKGMRVVRAAADLADAWRAATGEATSAFGAPSLIVERYLGSARHVEVQLIADDANVVALGERDCSVQRRWQKLIEETPGPSVTSELRERLFRAATAIARQAHYRSAGTAEFLVAPDGSIVFLEVNTRLQVEHPITEMVTGLDLVKLQLAIAAGERLPFTQADVQPRGAAIECRITAEDVSMDFMPAAGVAGAVRFASGPGVRVDTALLSGTPVPTEYDPLLAKLITYGADRAEALARMRRALAETFIAGVPTSLPFHRAVFAEPDFVAGRYDTGYVGSHWPPASAPALDESGVVAAAVALVSDARGAPLPRAVTRESAWSRAAREDGLR